MMCTQSCLTEGRQMTLKPLDRTPTERPSSPNALSLSLSLLL